MHVTFTKLYADEAGESHFEDLSTELISTNFALNAPPLYLSELNDAAQYSFFGAPAGWQSDWHPSSSRNLFVVLTGEWEVSAGDGETRKFGPGSVLLVEDISGKGHTSRVSSSEDSLSVLIQLP
jgi:quercetin dioxygenase-like cupin family protein